jgi:CrcB protein
MSPAVTAATVVVGGLGATTRLVVDGAVRARWRTMLPWATVLINVTGSLLLGVLTGLILYRGVSADARLVLGTGFCGGYTTFSTASVETVRLAQQRRFIPALLYAVATAGLSLAAAAVGIVVAR